jgi:MFS family permease
MTRILILSIVASSGARMQNATTKPRSPLLPIFLIVLIDIMGFTIVIPLLAFYAEKFDASPLVATTLVSVYAVCSLLSTPIIGRLSDQYGRKPLLMISQAGTCLGFIVLAARIRCGWCLSAASSTGSPPATSRPRRPTSPTTPRPRIARRRSA